MSSKVSGFLNAEMADVIKQGVIAPLLDRTFRANFSCIAQINKAHILMLLRQSIISRETASAIAAALLDMNDAGPEAVAIDHGREDAYFNFEAELIRRTSPDLGGQAHTGRSRNDINATIDRLKARDHYMSIVDGVIELRQALILQAERYSATLMPAYTHMQPAQPSTYGWFLLGIEEALQRDTARLFGVLSRLNLSPLGAGAVVGTSFPLDRLYAATLLGFDGIVSHAQDAVATRDCVFELLNAVTLLSITVGRMAQDFYNMTTFEFSTLNLPDHIAATSSIMPQKKNMAVLETLKGRPAQLIGAMTTSLASQKAISFSHTQETSIDSGRWLWDSLSEYVRLLPVASLVVRDAEPLAARMSELVRTNFSTATDLAELLVTHAGLSFREAHHVVGRFVRLLTNREYGSASEPNLLRESSRQVLNRELSLDDAILWSALDPSASLERKASEGSPSSVHTAKLIAAAQQVLTEDIAFHIGTKDRLDRACDHLNREFLSLVYSAGGTVSICGGGDLSS